MLQAFSILLVGASVVGMVLVVISALALWRHLGERTRPATHAPAMSILKPLCGVDDELAANLESFAALDYPSYEVLLGVKDARDAAYPLACAAAARWPGKFRVVLQRGAAGANPKVNQLITLAAAARYGVVVVSDSNIRVGRDYLKGIAACFEDVRVGLVTHAIVGVGERRLGALLDNLHLTASIAPGMVAAKKVAHAPVVVGKSMALRKADLAALGGFASVKDVLAEDYVLGRRVMQELGKEVVVAREAVMNVAVRRSAGDFYRRYLRWSVIHRKAVSAPVYAGEVLLNPGFLAMAAWAAAGGEGLVATVSAGVVVGRIVVDWMAARLLGRRGVGVVMAPVRDLLLGIAWAAAYLRDDVTWRGNRLRVLPGTRLELVGDGAVDGAAEAV